MNSLSNMDDFKKLQQRINHDSIQYQFRSKLIGGLNQDDVTEYIEFIENKFHKLEDENKRELEEIFSLRVKLSSEIEEKNNLLKISDELQSSVENYVSECENKDMIIHSISKKDSAEINQLHNEIFQLKEEKKVLENQLYDYNIKIEQLKEYAAKFENDNNVLKLKITDLEKEISSYVFYNDKINKACDGNELQQQLTQEKVRADRCENDLSTIVKLVSILKDELYIEQNLLETQFNHIMEKRNKYQSEIYNCINNLKI